MIYRLLTKQAQDLGQSSSNRLRSACVISRLHRAGITRLANASYRLASDPGQRASLHTPGARTRTALLLDHVTDPSAPARRRVPPDRIPPDGCRPRSDCGREQLQHERHVNSPGTPYRRIGPGRLRATAIASGTVPLETEGTIVVRPDCILHAGTTLPRTDAPSKGEVRAARKAHPRSEGATSSMIQTARRFVIDYILLPPSTRLGEVGREQ